MLDKLQILELFAFYREAPAQQRRDFQAAASRVDLTRGAHYFREGSACTDVALVGRGRLRVFKNSPYGREVTLYRVGAGETCLLTIYGALGDVPYPASAITETSVEAVLFPARQFRTWVDTVAAVRAFAFSAMARRTVDLMTLLQETVFRRLDQRLAESLLRRFQGEPEAAGQLLATHESIADDLGSSREVVSRLLEELERKGAIALGRGRIRLVDIDVLRDLTRG